MPSGVKLVHAAVGGGAGGGSGNAGGGGFCYIHDRYVFVNDGDVINALLWEPPALVPPPSITSIFNTHIPESLRSLANWFGRRAERYPQMKMVVMAVQVAAHAAWQMEQATGALVARMEAIPLLWVDRDKATTRISSISSKASNSL